MSNGNNDQKSGEQSQLPDLGALGRLISKKRRDMNLSVADLAKIVDVSVADIEALESGTWDVDVVLLLEIAQALRYRLSDEFKFPTS